MIHRYIVRPGICTRCESLEAIDELDTKDIETRLRDEALILLNMYGVRERKVDKNPEALEALVRHIMDYLNIRPYDSVDATNDRSHDDADRTAG